MTWGLHQGEMTSRAWSHRTRGVGFLAQGRCTSSRTVLVPVPLLNQRVVTAVWALGGWVMCELGRGWLPFN